MLEESRQSRDAIDKMDAEKDKEVREFVIYTLLFSLTSNNYNTAHKLQDIGFIQVRNLGISDIK